MAALACNLPGQGVAPTATLPGGRAATIRELSGEVVTQADESGPETPATSGQTLGAGVKVITRGDSLVRFELPDSAGLVRMGPDSALTVQDLTTGDTGPVSRFKLDSGVSWVVLSENGGEAIVETPGGTASTRGQMSVEYLLNDGTGAPRLIVTCLVGPCAANNSFNGVTLSPGEQTEAQGNAGFSDPRPIDEEQLEAWKENVPEAAELATATPTLTETSAFTPTDSPTPSETPTASLTPSLTPTASRTLIPWTLTPTFTPSPTFTNTPQFTATSAAPGASITADDTTLDEPGDCTILRWTATNAREVYLNGEGLAGASTREVCPNQTTTYTLRVVGYDNSAVESSVTVEVEDEVSS